MRILVTGAFGSIGRHTVPLLLARGHRVRALSEKGSASDRRIAAGWRGDVEVRVAKLLDGFAGAYRLVGDLEAASKSAERALAITEKAVGPTHPLVAPVLVNLGTLAQEQKRYADAESYARRGLALEVRLYGKKHPAVALDLSNLANASRMQGRIDEAIDRYRQAIAIYDENGAKYNATCSTPGTTSICRDSRAASRCRRRGNTRAAAPRRTSAACTDRAWIHSSVPHRELRQVPMPAIAMPLQRHSGSMLYDLSRDGMRRRDWERRSRR